MRILFKILLLPVALVCFVLAIFVQTTGWVLTWALRLLAVFFTLAFFMFLIRGITESNMETMNMILCGAVATAITVVAMFIESLPLTLSRFSAWVWAL